MWQWFSKGGVVMYPLLACSAIALGIILERLWRFHALLRQAGKFAPSKLTKQAYEQMASGLVSRLQEGLPTLETIVTIAPMLGILGTITGVIHSFELLGQGAMELNKANLGAGLAEALITTEYGLFIAIPALAAANYFRRRLEIFVDACNRQLAHGEEETPC